LLAAEIINHENNYLKNSVSHIFSIYCKVGRNNRMPLQPFLSSKDNPTSFAMQALSA